MSPGVTVERHESPAFAWTMVRRPPHPGLAALVGPYVGYVERSALPLYRRQVAHGGVVLILGFGDALDVRLGDDAAGGRFGSFVAGLHDGWARTGHGGRQHGIEVRLTPLGVHRLLGLPASAVARRVVALADLSRPVLPALVDRLAATPGWEARFALLDEALLRAATDGPAPDPAVGWAWAQLEASHGRVPVGVLADEIGWSRRHFATRFRHQIGLPPKAAARILRFDRAVGLLTAGGSGAISDVAAACGYADHSHLVRDFHDLAGCTPSALLRDRLPDGGGVAG